MPIWKHLMWPIALIWGLVAWIRNRLYDSGFLSSAEFEIPVISIGNLSMGGSGKTPLTEHFLYRYREMIPIAVLSRGYRRQTTGFRIAGLKDNYTLVGDEVRQMKSKFPQVTFAVGENRALAIPTLLQQEPQVKLIILDDAYQHRSVLPALNILLTPYDQPFWKDWLFPVGWLRETASNSKRADIIVITKCPNKMTADMEAEILNSFKPMDKQKLFYSTVQYGVPYQFLNPTNRRSISNKDTVLLFSGIANGIDMKEYLAGIASEVIWMEFDDHYNYEQRDLQALLQTFNNVDEENKVIITTEKDVVRLEPYREFVTKEKLEIFCLPIRVEFTGSNKGEFDKLVVDYINYYYGAESGN